jgi:hypothetical protein
MNKESVNTTFWNRRGDSNVDLTVITNQLRRIVKWEISKEESCSEHSIIQYAIGQGNSHRNIVNFKDVRYIVKKENYANFQENLFQLAEKKLYKLKNQQRAEDLDNILYTHI